MEMITRFNAISMWVAHTILVPTRYRVRAKRFEKLIRIAAELQRINNFQTLMAFLGGMNNAAISRLKFTKVAIGKRAMQKLLDLETLMNMESSYARYREVLHASNPPIIPYLGVYLGDLTFIEDGNPDFHDDTLINFSKRRLLFKTVSEIERYQAKRPDVKADLTLSQLLYSIPTFSEATLYDLSLKREPRGATKETIS
jgi:RasGEF domain